MRECTHSGKYLGSPFCKFTSRSKDFNYLAERMATKLSGWKSKHLSIAGCLTLIKAVTSAIPSYTMQVFLLPSSLCDLFDKLNRRFLWGINGDWKRFLSLKAWDNICVPKYAGGLGIRRARDTNIAYITKLGWILCTDLSRIWVRLIRSKYLRGRRVTDFQYTTRASSWIWQGVKWCKDSLDNRLCFSIGQNSRIQIWEDPWLPGAP